MWIDEVREIPKKLICIFVNEINWPAQKQSRRGSIVSAVWKFSQNTEIIKLKDETAFFWL